MAKTVLIVEDERAIVEILKFNLKREGYETLEALDGQTGLQLAQTEDPDLILLDVMLPKMNGFDICKTLRAENRATPIIMLTAREEEMDKVFGLETGADDYMTKPFLIMVILILALMLTTGAFLMSGVGNFYVSQFYEQMEGTFTPEFIAQLQRLSAEDNAPAQMKELLMAQAGLGIDITGRNVYILDQTGSVLDSSNQRTTVVMTQNILSAMNGEVGQSSSVTNDYMDLAVPVDSDGAQYIAYIRDNRATVDALTSELLIIILRALALGLVICVILSFLLSQILITPIRALTVGTKRVAAGDFANRVTVDSRDEIGDLTRNFNHMAKVLQDTISEAENERNKLSTLFLHMTDGVVAFNTAGSVIHYNPAATQMLAQNLSGQTTFDEIFEGGGTRHAPDAAQTAVYRNAENRRRA